MEPNFKVRFTFFLYLQVPWTMHEIQPKNVNANTNANALLSKLILSVCLAWLILPTYFTIQLIFASIHESHHTISTNFYIYLQYQKVFSFSKISGSQTDP